MELVEMGLRVAQPVLWWSVLTQPVKNQCVCYTVHAGGQCFYTGSY